MSDHVVVQGTVKPDGTLELDGKIPMPAGRVLVTIQPAMQLPADDPFWQIMQGIWAEQRARGHVPRSAEEVEAERKARRMRTWLWSSNGRPKQDTSR
jgi:hypothetical protein